MFLSCFFFICYGDHRDLHSFPTRRSSDLSGALACAAGITPTSMAVSSTTAKMKTSRSEEHTSELQSHHDLVCRLLLEKKNERHRHAHAVGKIRGRVNRADQSIDTRRAQDH